MSKKIFQADNNEGSSGSITVWQMEPDDPDYSAERPFYIEAYDPSLTPDQAAALAAALSTASFPLQRSSKRPPKTTTPFKPGSLLRDTTSGDRRDG